MLYDVTKQVCWTQPRKFQNLVVHPGGMYINSHLLASRNAQLGILCHCSLWKSKWYFQRVKAMIIFLSVAAALSQRFLSTGQKTFDGIVQYLKTPRIHLTDPHWVDNLLPPTLLIHQFERAEQKGEFQLK